MMTFLVIEEYLNVELLIDLRFSKIFGKDSDTYVKNYLLLY